MICLSQVYYSKKKGKPMNKFNYRKRKEKYYNIVPVIILVFFIFKILANILRKKSFYDIK